MQISLIKMFGFTGSQSVHGVTHDAPPPFLDMDTFNTVLGIYSSVVMMNSVSSDWSGSDWCSYHWSEPFFL